MRWSVRDLLVAHRLTGAGLDPGQVEELTRDIEWRTIRLSEEGEKEDQGLAILLAIVLLMILYSSILMWGQIVMTSIIEEKGSRVIEVVASGVPTQLLAGKPLGVYGKKPTFPELLHWVGRRQHPREGRVHRREHDAVPTEPGGRAAVAPGLTVPPRSRVRATAPAQGSARRWARSGRWPRSRRRLRRIWRATTFSSRPVVEVDAA